jgi:hypothetical protein
MSVGEVTGLDQCIAYAQHLAGQAATHGPDGNEVYLGRLVAAGVTGAGLLTGSTMQQAFAAAAATATAHAAELGKQTTVQEAYDANPDAGDKAYQTGNAGGGIATPSRPGGAPSHRARSTGDTPPGSAAGDGDQAPPPWPDDKIQPQWPGHKPPRRWEWKVSAHKPGDPRHVNWALASVDLNSEEALRAYVQDALQRYDSVELHHWYTGSELTFTRQPDGSVGVNRRQLNPTAGAPGHRRW